jgi:hypothetical protein
LAQHGSIVARRPLLPCDALRVRGTTALVARAAQNNAELCAAVARSHGVAGVFSDDAWTAPERTPPRYPDAVTLVPRVDAASLLGRIDDSDGASVKDSFHDLELARFGYRVLFDAEWIHRSSAARRGMPESDDEPVVLLADGIGSVRVNCSGDDVGVSNVEPDAGTAESDLWRWLVAVVGDRYPGLDVVGYESGSMLDAARAAGFTAIGPLRIWIRG